jgi:hypothetical protein
MAGAKRLITASSSATPSNTELEMVVAVVCTARLAGSSSHNQERSNGSEAPRRSPAYSICNANILACRPTGPTRNLRALDRVDTFPVGGWLEIVWAGVLISIADG